MQAVQDLAVGWINDWFAGTHDGVYGTAGSTVDIPPTSAGIAQALILPIAVPKLNIIQSLSQMLIDSLQVLNQLQVCATPCRHHRRTDHSHFRHCAATAD